MSFVLRGHICGELCEITGQREDIDNTEIRIYRAEVNQDTLNRVAARPVETIAPLSPEQVKAKTERLIATSRTDEGGDFKIAIDEKHDYSGSAIEIDLYLTRAPMQANDAPEPLQVSLTTIQPRWRQTDNTYTAVWDFCIPHSIWCAIRRRLDAWVILGRLVVCNTEDDNGNKIPLVDYTVNAIDNDWIQDDPLGSAVTDSNGVFRIDYTSNDFTRTPLTPIGIRFESFGEAGPDVYFQVRRNSDNALMLDEPEERGLDSDRVNRQPCWCVELCLAVDEDQPDYPFFTQVGVFKLPSHIYTSGAQIGRTNTRVGSVGGDGWGFRGNLRLVGLMPQRHPDNNQPMKYRFLFGSTDTPTTPMTSLSYVRGIQIGTILRGFIINPGGWLEPQFDTVGVVPTASTTTFDVNLVPDANGWVTVPQDSDFNPNNNLMTFHSPGAVSGGSVAGSFVAGNPVPAGNQMSGSLVYIRLQATDVGETGSMYQSAAYPVYVNNWVEIGRVNLGELAADPCSEVVGNNINIRFTADHEFMRDWSLGISSDASPWTAPSLPNMSNPNPNPPTSPAPVTSVRGVVGNYRVDTTTWPSCTYRITLAASLRVTDGDNNDPSNTRDAVMFYIQK